MTEYIRTFIVKDGDTYKINKWMSFRLCNENQMFHQPVMINI